MSFVHNEMFQELVGETLTLKIDEMSLGNEVEIPFYYYDIILNSTNEQVGKISIRIGENFHSYYNGHVGYYIEKAHQGHSYAYQACKMVLPVAAWHGMKYIYLTCNEDNVPSYKTIEKLGAVLQEIVAMPEDYFGWYEGIPPHRIYRLDL